MQVVFNFGHEVFHCRKDGRRESFNARVLVSPGIFGEKGEEIVESFEKCVYAIYCCCERA